MRNVIIKVRFPFPMRMVTSSTLAMVTVTMVTVIMTRFRFVLGRASFEANVGFNHPGATEALGCVAQRDVHPNSMTKRV